MSGVDRSAEDRDPPELRVDRWWYRLAYPDVLDSGLTPRRHFAEKGEQEGRAPSPLFDPARYLELHPDVAAAGFPPVTHWRLHGRAEGRPAPPFDRGPGEPLGPVELGRRLAATAPRKRRATLLFHHPRLLRLGDHTNPFIRTLIGLWRTDDEAAASLLPKRVARELARRQRARPQLRLVVESGDPVAEAVTRLGALADPASATFAFEEDAADQLPELCLPAGVWPAPGAIGQLLDDVRRRSRDPAGHLEPVPLEQLGDLPPPTARRGMDIADFVRLCSGPGSSAAVVPVAPRRQAVVVDSRLPTPDRDSGSMSTLQYARALARLGYQVVVHGLSRDGSEERRALEREGFPVVAALEKPYDLALLMRAETFEATAHQLRALGVGILGFVPVDLHHRRLAAEAVVEEDDDVADLSSRMARLELANVAAADVTLVNSTAELAYLREVAPTGARVEHVPMARPVPPYRLADDERDDEIVFLGGFLHRPNVDAVTWFLDQVWPRVSAVVPGARFAVYGADLPAALRERAGAQVLMHGYVATVDEAFARARLAVVPLRYGAGVKGKLVTTVLAGVPVVTTPVGIEGLELPPAAVTVAADAAGLADAIVALWSDPTARETQRRRAYDAARERYTLDALVERLAVVLDPVCGVGAEQPQ